MIRKTAFILYTFFFGLLSISLQAQQSGNEVRLSGIVVDGSVSDPVPNATVKNISGNVTALADSTGFFSLYALPGDTIQFEAMLYKPGFYVVPKGVGGSHFAVIEVLEKDALELEEVTVTAFPTQQQFERAILEVDPGNVADKTLRLDAHVEEVTEDPTNMQQYILNYNKKYYRRQMTYLVPATAPYNNFLQPERWSKFISDWREGRFDEESLEKLQGFPAEGQGEISEYEEE